jgi:uncharacterized protein
MTNPAQKRTALVTGASAGIGAAFSRLLAERGFDLVVTARRTDRLESLAQELRGQWGVGVRVLPADLADPAAPERLHDQLNTGGVPIDVLVNNAGYGVPGTFIDHPWQEHDAFIRVMITAVSEMCHRFLGGMLDRGYGRIINVASLAGLLPAPAGHTLYAASKACLIKFSEALALEVRPKGVYVTALCPGFTYSEFHDVSRTRDLVSRLPRWLWLDADAVAREGLDAVMAGRIICVTGRVNRALALLARHLPEPLVLRMMQPTV